MSVHRDLNTSIKSALTAGNRTIAKEKLYRVMRKTDLFHISERKLWYRVCQTLVRKLHTLLERCEKSKLSRWLKWWREQEITDPKKLGSDDKQGVKLKTQPGVTPECLCFSSPNNFLSIQDDKEDIAVEANVWIPLKKVNLHRRLNLWPNSR